MSGRFDTLAWIFASASAMSCNFSAPDDIPCGSDDQCPTSYFCSTTGRCAAAAGGGPAELGFVGVARSESAPPAPSIELEAKGKYQSFVLTMRNVGQSQAPFPLVSLTAAACLDLVASAQVKEPVGPGATARVKLNADPNPGCASPITVDVVLSADGSKAPKRATSAQFVITLR